MTGHLNRVLLLKSSLMMRRRRNNDLYQVTVRATEAAAVGGGPAKSTELDVTVTVTNADDPGTVEVKWRQPEVDTPIMAILTDGDATDDAQTALDTVVWQWFRAKVSSPDETPDDLTNEGLASEWVLAGGEDSTTDTYTPDGDDENRFLLARASYQYRVEPGTPVSPGDPETGTTTMAFGISEFRTQADVLDDVNNSPDFRHSTATRTIDEDAAVGDPVGRVVEVDINEDHDTLTYELVMAEEGDDGNDAVVMQDLEFFSIDKKSGQIMVAKTLSAEETDDRNYDATVQNAEVGGYSR